MTLKLFIALLLTAVLAGCGGKTAPAPEPTEPSGPNGGATKAPAIPDGADSAAAAAAILDAAGDANVIRGVDDWLFIPSELKFLSKGEFWGARAPEVTAALKKDWADPLPAIMGFQQNLKARNIELLVVPIPPKATIHADKLPGMVAQADTDALPTFINALKTAQVPVLDLTAAMKAKAVSGVPMHCTTDTHWSPQAIELAADEIYKTLKSRPWATGIKRQTYAVQPVKLKYEGDLVSMGELSIPPETFNIQKVHFNGDAIPEDPDSPILVIGDSHTLFCHDPKMVTSGAGLSDHLAHRFGTPIDLIGIRGSASSATRQTLMSKQNRSVTQGGNYMAKKKVVIWCFTAREFTESTGGWREFPAKFWK